MERELRLVPIAEIREPVMPARVEIPLDGIAELADDIRRNGLINPLTVHDLADGTVQVDAGHRRLLACRMVPLVNVPCWVAATAEGAEAAKLSENLIRRELNPAEEALWLSKLFVQHGNDIDRVAALIRRSADYVSSRLLLLQLEPEILEAVRKGEISMTVGQALGEFTERDDQLFYLDYARRAGATARQMRIWVSEVNMRRELAQRVPTAAGPEPAAGAETPSEPAPGPSYNAIAQPWELMSGQATRPCKFCEKPHPEFRMFRFLVCEPCALGVTEELKRRGL